ncbi:MAG: hypothetical protein HQL76_06850 [Magnetococcales bacterium]|nr:hypothetical protein [Magnetococcales bacterium]
MTTFAPPPNINAQSDDNRVGFMFLSGLGLLYGAWNLAGDPSGFRGAILLFAGVPGVLFVFLAIRRLLRPGCRMILRINHGGVTDFRLSEQAVPWEAIVAVEYPRGWLGSILPAVVLVLEDGTFPPDRTLWCRALHALLSPVFPGRMILLCATLDVRCREIHRTVVLHHEHHCAMM